MKRLLSLLLMLCLLLPAGSALAATQGLLVEELATRTGPGTHYTEPGGFLQKGNEVTVHTKVWDGLNNLWWVQVEFTANAQRYRLYTGYKRMYANLNMVPTEAPLQQCAVNLESDAFAGPGWAYHLWDDKVPAGTSATLYEVEYGYAHIECYNPVQDCMWRVWVPLAVLDCAEDYEYSTDTYLPESRCDGWFTAGEMWETYYDHLPLVPKGGIHKDCGNPDSIMWVQQCLRSIGYGKLAVNGDWSGQTDQAVRAFKKDYGYDSSNTVVTWEMCCKMLDIFYQEGYPLRYLSHYLPVF